MVNWKKKEQGAKLCELFEKELADPTASLADEIDKYWKLDPCFEQITIERFRDNYRKTAQECIRGKGLQGIRRKDIKPPSGEPPEEYKFEPAEPSEPTPTPKKAPPKKMTLKPDAYVYKEDERPWTPSWVQPVKYISNGYHREELPIEPPASFNGAAGSYEAGFDSENECFVLKFAPNKIMTDPRYINSYCEHVFNAVTADDSSRNVEFKRCAEQQKGKWCTFRCKLDWKGKPSDDIGRFWIDWADICTDDDQSHPSFIAHICSIKPVQTSVEKVSMALSKNRFMSPPKPKKKIDTMSEATIAGIAWLKKMFPVMNEEQKLLASAEFGLTPEEIESKEMDIEELNKKRKI